MSKPNISKTSISKPNISNPNISKTSISKTSIENFKKVGKAIDYMTCFVFVMSLILHAYLIHADRTDGSTHTHEELAWMYGFFGIVIIGVIYNLINCFK
jgi:predicted small integral membrane protein